MKKNTLAFITLLVMAAGILGLRFGKVIAEPNGYLFSLSEDAVKSYFNFSWYLDYGKGIRHDGINYPYGDHLQYINSHPLYSQLLKIADPVLPVTGNGVGILNLTMILSLFLAVPFLYLIMRKFSLPPWYAAVITLVILFLSPQIGRMGGHFEMVYAFFIPLYWYLLIRWNEGQKRWLWTALLLVTSLVGGFTSAYYAAFLAIFPLAVLLVQVWNHRKSLLTYLPQGLHLLLIALAPLIIVKGFVSATDWVDDRPDNPWGFFIFHSNVFSIFLPQRSLLREVLHGLTDLKYQWEGRAYVGYPATLLALVILTYLMYYLVKKRKPERFFLLRRNPQHLYLAAAVIVLLFAMCIPFKWLRFLPDLLPPLKQFRCLGRFSWIFYYIFTVYTATVIYKFYRILRIRKYPVAALAFILLTVSYWGLEAGLNFKNGTKNLFNRNTLITLHGNEAGKALENAGYANDDFQAILFLPFANTCGDKLLFTRGMHAFAQAMKCSYQTRTPLIQSFSPRLSFTQAMSSIQLLADSTIYKIRIRDMDDRPVLLVLTREDMDPAEQRLADRAKVFYEGDDFRLAGLSTGSFNEGFSRWTDTVRSLADSLETVHGNIRTNVPASMVLYKGFEDHLARHVFTGRGAMYQRKGSMELFMEPLYEIYGDAPVEISFWLYADHRKDNMPAPELRRWDKDGNLTGKEKLESRAVHNVDGMWVRVSTVVRAMPETEYQLTVRGEYVTVDDLLVKPQDARVGLLENGKPVLFDNFRVPVEHMD